MFTVVLTYVKPLDVVDAHLPAHVEFLKAQFAKGIFLASGRQKPRVGGVILARAADEDTLREVLRQDPFHRNEIATYQVIEFAPTLTAPELEFLKEA